MSSSFFFHYRSALIFLAFTGLHGIGIDARGLVLVYASVLREWNIVDRSWVI